MAQDRTPADFGSRLRVARERRGISLRQIAAATKISVAVLEALERNDVSRLPGGIFSRAFVRSYAVEVGLDPDKTVQDFVAAFPQEPVVAGHATLAPHEDEEAFESERRMASTFLGLIAISVPIAGAVLYFGTAGRRVAAPEPAPANPPPAVVKADPVPSPAPVESPVAPSPSPSRAAPAEPSSGFTVALSVRRECWVSAIVDGERTIARVLQPGDPRTLEVHREMILTAGDAAAVILTLNGAEARPLGKAGEVVTTRLNVSNFKGFLASP